MANEELWGEYAVGALFIIARFLVRLKLFGIRNFKLEDLFMLFALIAYTTVTVIIFEITTHGATIGQTPESVYLLPPETVKNMIIGQKLTFADWLIYLLYVWSLKATVLTMFTRLTAGLPWQTMMLRIVIGYTVVCFIGAALTHICVCLPVYKSWQVVPYPGDACALRNLNYYLVTFFNASSDLAIISIPLPIIFTARIPAWRRALLTFLLCSGIFVVVAAILRAYFSLKSLTTLPIAAGWTSRETMVAAVTVSLPGIKPIFSQKTWINFRSNKSDNSGNGGQGGKNNASGGRNWTHELVTIGGSREPAGNQMGSKEQGDWRVRGKELRGTRLSSDVGSEDIILDHGSEHHGGEHLGV